MGNATHFQCNVCGYEIITYGMTGFRYNNAGEKEHFSLSLRQNNIKNGVDGIYAATYCIACDEVFDITFLEYKRRIYEYKELFDRNTELKEGYSMDAYKKIIKNNREGYFSIEAKNRLSTEKQVCPMCRKRNTLLLYGNGRLEVSCPRCASGRLKSTITEHFD